MRKTAKTELRDFFLAARCAGVVTVPYFEFDEYSTPEKQRTYVEDRLLARAADVRLSASASSAAASISTSLSSEIYAADEFDRTSDSDDAAATAVDDSDDDDYDDDDDDDCDDDDDYDDDFEDQDDDKARQDADADAFTAFLQAFDAAAELDKLEATRDDEMNIRASSRIETDGGSFEMDGDGDDELERQAQRWIAALPKVGGGVRSLPHHFGPSIHASFHSPHG